MPFRRLLLIENVFDFGDVKVKDEMRPLTQVAFCCTPRTTLGRNRDKILSTTFSRYPLWRASHPDRWAWCT
jgi:CBS domain containing-hemolysin-like protein